MSADRARGRRVTLNDVAAVAGVDKAVVSRLVNQDPTLSIRPATRERVLAAIKELGYRPNVAARSLRTTRSGTLGLFIPDFANPVYAEIITGAESAALAAGYVLVTGSSTVAGRRTQAYLDLLGEGRVDGLLLAGGEVTATEQAGMAASGLPWLQVNRRGRGSNRHVILADDAAARLAVEHLLELGHTRIAHIAGPPRADTATRRRRGYRMALEKANIPEDPGLMAAGDYTPQGGADAMHRLLRSGARPTGVFVSNVASAVGVLNALRQHGLSVPEDVSVIAVHDIPFAEFLVPPLTTVRMPLRQLGIRSVELLLERGPNDPISDVVGDPIDLVVRESTAPPA